MRGQLGEPDGSNTSSISPPQPTSSAAMPPAPMGWAGFAPDGWTVVTAADKGVLTLRDAATHPDWSPDGRTLAVTLGPMTDANMDVKAGSIAVLPFSGGDFGQVLVATAGGMDNNYVAKWSPDGGYLAYVHADGSSRGASPPTC